MKHSSLFLITLVTAAFGIPALANSALFEVLDRDNSGYLTLDETQSNPQVHLQFSQIDRNKNGRIEPEELQLHNIPLNFEDLDLDKNAAITFEEASALRALQNQFNQFDKNKDQVIDPSEFAAFMQSVQN